MKNVLWGVGAFVEGRSHGDLAHTLDPDIVFNGREHCCVTKHGDVYRIRTKVFLSRTVYGYVSATRDPAEIEVERCLIDTGAVNSVFRPEYGRKLQLDPNKDVRELHGANSRPLGWYCTHYITARFNEAPPLYRIKACLPVARLNLHNKFLKFINRKKRGTPEGPWIFDDFYKGDNILGMQGVLCSSMLCFTPQRLFVWCRK